MKEGRNIFKLDGPIGRKTFLKSALFIACYISFVTLVIVLLHFIFELNKYTLIPFIILWVALFIFSIYTSCLNFAKRFWDLFGNKADAIFYAIAIFIINFAYPFIPIIKYVGIVFSIVVLILLLMKDGKLIKAQPKDKNDVA